MRSELQFFMHPADDAEFEKVAVSMGIELVRGPKSEDSLVVGDIPIQFLRSRLAGSVLTSGRISIATTGLNDEANYREPDLAERAYGRLRAWIRKTYSNRLECISADGRIVQPTKNLWIGRHAADCYTSMGVQLRHFAGSVAFRVRAP